jgi:hypothetical protein
MTRRVVATSDHTVPDRLPLQLRIGETVQIGERDTEWPAFVFVTTPTGNGWAPSRYLSATTGSGSVLVPYNTKEVATHVGEPLEVVAEDPESGWLWCRTAAGEEGWVPIKTVTDVAAGNGET